MKLRAPGLIALALFLPAAGCDRPQEAQGPIEVSVIGPPASWIDPGRGALPAPSAALLGATAQGLVRFDQAGEIRPGLAIRWALSDDGRSLIFRVKPTRTPVGGRIDAPLIAARLNAARRLDGRNPLRGLLGAIDDIDAITDEVVEIRLIGPRPNILQLLAQPDLAITRARSGAGPFAAVPSGRGAVTLTLRADALPPDSTAVARPIRLRGERAALAIVRFRAGVSKLVLGGTFGDLPLLRPAGVPAEALAIDPVDGLFGLAFDRADGALADRRLRTALSMAIDRDRIVALADLNGWHSQTRLVPGGLDDLAGPADPEWSPLPLDQRRTIARDVIAGLASQGTPVPPLRLALPPGPGSNLLFGAIARDWAAIGVRAVRATAGEPSDLHLVDSVAAADSAAWYLRQFTCAEVPVCSEAADTALLTARAAPTLEARSAELARADALLAEQAVFIPIAAPLRWSLVAPGTRGFTPNRRGAHPLMPVALAESR